MGSGSGFRVNSALTNASLFEKLGGDDGIRTLVEKMYAKIEVDPLIAKYFQRPGLDSSMLKDKFRFFLIHLTGGAENWIGRPLEDVHRFMRIQDAEFDCFNSHCIQTLKEMRRLKVDGLKQMIGLLQGLRDKIVSKGDEGGADPSQLIKGAESLQQSAQ
jgi:hemoglobin